MLAKDLSTTEKEEFKVMLRRHPSLFVSDYKAQLEAQSEAGSLEAMTSWKNPARSLAD